MYLGPLHHRSVSDSETFPETIPCHPLNLSHLFSAEEFYVPKPRAPCVLHNASESLFVLKASEWRPGNEAGYAAIV